MNFSVTQNTYRPAPVRGAIVLRCKSPDFCAPIQLKISVQSFDTGHLIHDSVRQIRLIVMSNGRANIQIPIDRRLL